MDNGKQAQKKVKFYQNIICVSSILLKISPRELQKLEYVALN